MGKIFFTGDLHFGHKKVIAFDKRPFATVEEMDAELIRRWNNKVSKDDLVYVLGDMIWKTHSNDASDIIKSLNGQVILIKGNHDKFLLDAEATEALAGIKDYDEFCVDLEDGTRKKVFLSHYFTPMYSGHFHQVIHLHAHSHFSDEADFEVDFAAYLNSIGCRNEIYNVGCMYWNYEPVTLDEIIAHGKTIRPNYGEISDDYRTDRPRNRKRLPERNKKFGITYSATLDRTEERISKTKAISLFESGMLDTLEAGTFESLAKIHEHLFTEIFDFAGTLRAVNLSKGTFRFAPVMYLEAALTHIEKMPQSTFDQIIEKYVEMNIAHPFREGNGRSTRIWLDQMLKKELGFVIDWSRVDKEDYLLAMEHSAVKDTEIKALLKAALTDRVHDLAVYMKGIDASYHYEGYNVFCTEALR